MTHTEQELDAFGTWEREAWEVRAAPYAASLGDLTRGSIPALLDAASVQAGTRVLDVGTGPGFVALAAAQRGAVVAAADQSAAMVQMACTAGVDAVVAPVEDLPYEDGSFDAVVAGYLLNHLPRPCVAAASLARVLRPGGRVALTVWDVPEENVALGAFGPIAEALGLTAAVPPGPDSQRFSADGAMQELLDGAFRDVTVERVRWTVTVEPGAWFDAVAAATPRTGAVLAAASGEQRAELRSRYVEAVTTRYGTSDGRVELPAVAVLGSGVRV
jgi:SAM-dependent methyltransferase